MERVLVPKEIEESEMQTRKPYFRYYTFDENQEITVLGTEDSDEIKCTCSRCNDILFKKKTGTSTE